MPTGRFALELSAMVFLVSIIYRSYTLYRKARSHSSAIGGGQERR